MGFLLRNAASTVYEELKKTINAEAGPYVNGTELTKRAADLVGKKADMKLGEDILVKYVK
jgi:hypothetical protein